MSPVADASSKTLIAECPYYGALLRRGAGLLFRGSDLPTDAVHRVQVRRDRRPLSTSVALHTAADAWFSRTFGIRYRGAALFCTGDWKTQAVYGRPFAILPVDGFRFCWSPSVPDLFVWIERRHSDPITPENLAEHMERAGYQETDFASAVASGNEIMVACDSYYAVPLRDENHASHLLDELRKCASNGE